MAEMSVETKGMEQIQNRLASLGREMDKTTKKAHGRIEPLVHRDAVMNAPKSPTKFQYEQTLVGKKSKRTDLNPGGLERSIEVKHNNEYVHVFVSDTSEAKKYAVKMENHDGNWGTGTKAKGARAGNKYMERARKDNEKNIKLIYDDEINSTLKRLN